MSDRDLALFATLNVAQIVDLRSAHERALHPSRLPHGREPNRWESREHSAGGNLIKLMASPSVTLDDLRNRMIDIYAGFPVILSDTLRAVLNMAQAAENGAMLVHCAAGKDRTGFVIAMLLRAIGICEKCVYADYESTNATTERARAELDKSGLIQALEHRLPGAAPVVLSADRQYLNASDRVIRENWGSVDTYLREICAFDDRKAARLRQRYLLSA